MADDPMPAASSATADPVVSVILPTYNECDNIGPLLRRLDTALQWESEILVVDDNSPDGTGDIASELASEIPGVRFVQHEGERSLTGSIQQGIDEARGSIVVWMDADLQHPPELVPDLVRQVMEEGYDAAIASRHVPGGRDEFDYRAGPWVFLQQFLTRRLSRWTRRQLKTTFSDWTSGFIAIRADVIKDRRLRGEYGEYFIYLMAELIGSGCRWIELPVENPPRRAGRTKTASGPVGLLLRGLRYVKAVRSIRQVISAMTRIFLVVVVLGTLNACSARKGVSVDFDGQSVHDRMQRPDRSPVAGRPWAIASPKLKLVWCPPGQFIMGSNQAERDWAAGPQGRGAKKTFTREGGPPRRTWIKEGFWIGQTEVTVAQFSVFVISTGYSTDAERGGAAFCPDWAADGRWRLMAKKSWRDPNYNYPVGDDFPVTCMTWNDAMAFCRWLTERENVAGRGKKGYEYRLPTEAEWEYACRGGRQRTMFWWGDDWKDAEGRTNIAANDLPSPNRIDLFPWTDGWAFAAPVEYFGIRGRNGFGLSDMLGNAWEWCMDYYSDDGAKPTYNAERSDSHVLRGSGFDDFPGFLRCANRERPLPRPHASVGFRLVYAVAVETGAE